MSSGPPGARVFCTLGMHRSGTSLVSRILNLLGVHLGPGRAISKTGEDNPRGYWEHESIVALNDAILARFGGRWDDPPELPPSWLQDPRLEDLRDEARQLLARDFAGKPLWGWKDPRTCLTLPFWQELVGPMHYLICVRNPCAVAASLDRRNAMSFERSDRLWLLHAKASLLHTSGQPRIFVSYEDLVDDWRPALRGIAAFIGAPEAAEDPRVQESVNRFVEKEMCHHRTSMEDLRGDPRVSSATRSCYVDLVLRADAWRPGRHDAAPGRARRAVAFVRSVIGVALPPGTRRRGLFNAIVRPLARRLPPSRIPRPVVDPPRA